jgi:hypothetical protein
MQYITQLALAAESRSAQTTPRNAPHQREQLYLLSRIVKEQPIDESLGGHTRQARTRACLLIPPRISCASLGSRRALRAGGANRDRTDDLLLAKQALSQLSYGPRTEALVLARRRLVGLDGFEPSTPALSRRCSNQLSYRPARVAQKKSCCLHRSNSR